LLGILCSISVQVYSNCLLSHYPFNGNANDIVSNHHGTVNGAVLTQDRFGNPNSAYRFIDDYISIPHQPFFLPNYSYAMWVRPLAHPSAGNAFIYFSVGGIGGDQNVQIENNQNNYALGYLTGFTITAYNINGNLRAGVATGSLPKLGEWYHVVCTRDTNFYKIYLNGCLVSVSKNLNGSLPFYGNSAHAAKIGSRNDGSKPFNGDLDDVRIYNCALTPNEIAALYNNFQPLKVSPDTAICKTNFSPFSIKASSGYCTYKWIDISDRQTVLSTDSTMLVNINKTTIFRVFVNTGDSQTVVVKLSELELLPQDTVFCSSFIWTAYLPPGNRYKWDTGPNDTLNSLTITDYGTYRVVLTEPNGCVTIDSVTITKGIPPPRSFLSDTILCFPFELQVSALPTNVRYNWSSGETSQSIQVTDTGRLILRVSGLKGCEVRDTMTISAFPFTYFDLGKDTFYCGPFLKMLEVDAEPGTYQWNTGESTKQIEVSTSGMFSVIYTDNYACKHRDTIVIQQFPEPVFSLAMDTVICEGRHLEILIQGMSDIVWEDFSQDTFRIISESGTYIARITDKNGCILIDTLNVLVQPSAKAFFSVSELELPIEKSTLKITNKATNYDSLHYVFGDGSGSDSLNPYYKYSQSGRYKITQYALSEFGCHDSFTLSVLIYDNFIFHIPTAFSPNEDGKNEVFKPYYQGVSPEGYELMIFNRWGECIYKSSDIAKGWDGTYMGERVQQGVYLYMMKVKSARLEAQFYKGTFTLLR